MSIFDGKTLDGWHLMNGAPFVAEDGVIKLNGGRGWLRSEKEYSDFVLKLEFRFMKPPRQDGGVFLRAGKEGKSWPNRKYEVQIENTERMAKIFGAVVISSEASYIMLVGHLPFLERLAALLIVGSTLNQSMFIR